jgi:preprotein translocase subunit SecD
MLSPRAVINVYLTLLTAAALLALPGCQSNSHQKKTTVVLRLHIENPPDDSDHLTQVPIFRAKPVQVSIDKVPFLDETAVARAEVIDDHGLHALQIQFNSHGRLVLEMVSGANPGRRIAIKSIFNGELRWLAAPVMNRHIRNGVLTFSPDATRAEAETIAKGLNRIAHHLRNDQE